MGTSKKRESGVGNRESLNETVRELPEGTREQVAYDSLGAGMERTAFREIWLRERCPREYGKAVIEQ